MNEYTSHDKITAEYPATSKLSLKELDTWICRKVYRSGYADT